MDSDLERAQTSEHCCNQGNLGNQGKLGNQYNLGNEGNIGNQAKICISVKSNCQEYELSVISDLPSSGKQSDSSEWSAS